jgi:rhamnosyltransferase
MPDDKRGKVNSGNLDRKVCAIIVTWNSGDEIYKSLPAIADQVAKIVVVDNGSRPDQLAVVEDAVKKFQNAALIKNQRNEGIASALNRGAEYALKNKYDWIITLDDAAKPEKNLVEKLFSAYDSLSPQDQEKTAVIAPNYANLKGPVYPAGAAHFTITAVQTGQLVKTAVWKKIGGYKEDLFITWVDHEFCFRLLRAGYKTLLVPSAILEETAGTNPVVKSVLWKKFVVPNYSPNRYYYMYRNSFYIYKNYWRLVPRWLLKNFMSEVFSFAKIVLFENQKLKKIMFIARGYLDGVRNKYGELTKS